MIYFARIAATGTIKIGFTDNLVSRINALKKHYDCHIEVLKTEPGDRDSERCMHERFADLRLRDTEQFLPGDELTAYLGLPAVPDFLLLNLREPSADQPVNFRLTPEAHRMIAELSERFNVPKNVIVDASIRFICAVLKADHSAVGRPLMAEAIRRHRSRISKSSNAARRSRASEKIPG